MTEDTEAYLKALARDMQAIRSEFARLFNYITEAESEVPEKMRRFIMYMHDVHDIVYMYESRGLQPPPYVHREMERCDDRYRQLLEDLHSDTGAFEKVRQEMTERGGTRYKHERLLPKREPTG